MLDLAKNHAAAAKAGLLGRPEAAGVGPPETDPALPKTSMLTAAADVEKLLSKERSLFPSPSRQGSAADTQPLQPSPPSVSAGDKDPYRGRIAYADRPTPPAKPKPDYAKVAAEWLAAVRAAAPSAAHRDPWEVVAEALPALVSALEQA